jgi:hypothetical protein
MTKSLTKVRFEFPIDIDDLCVDSDGSVDDMEDVEDARDVVSDTMNEPDERQLSGTIFSHEVFV